METALAENTTKAACTCPRENQAIPWPRPKRHGAKTIEGIVTRMTPDLAAWMDRPVKNADLENFTKILKTTSSWDAYNLAREFEQDTGAIPFL